MITQKENSLAGLSREQVAADESERKRLHVEYDARAFAAELKSRLGIKGSL